MQRSTFVIATFLLVCLLAVGITGSQLTREERTQVKRLFNKIIDKRVDKLIKKIERRSTYQEEADVVEESLMAHFLRIVNKFGLQQTKQLIIKALQVIDKSKIKYIESADLAANMQLSDESLAGYFFQVLSILGEKAFRTVFSLIDRFVDPTPPPPGASHKYRTQGDYDEMSDQLVTLWDYFWYVVGQIGSSAAVRIFNVIRRIFGDGPREQSDSAIALDFRQMVITAFPHMAQYINANWKDGKTMNWKEFYTLAFPNK
ncbi:predicted protein [Naegleria gruberi]|uniref:Predicted protein n=1 Tax=Naegleria gruberi TaxID=5762 RepID=D2V6G0_NAEGR|nr:uncharacterized protein NAEGRDRAFT_64422 [Naegleria gruberi]EFC47566.1 predicted protein [Naegleria gruberi]|eukprot:XP_002680310.1 predicted protein [Naegleria gruberi strain NEG-M]